LADVSRIVRYIAAENPVAARQIGRELLLAGDSLAILPRRGRPGRLAGTRELVVMPPYLIVYRVSGADAVTILRIWHAAQYRPGRAGLPDGRQTDA
jgi:toxin ParE1/3/4